MTKQNLIVRTWKRFDRFSVGAKIALIGFFLFFVVEAFIHIYPFVWVINNSLRAEVDININSTILTETWLFSNYWKVFTDFKVGTLQGDIYYLDMLINSTWQTFVYLFVNLSSSMFVAYNLAKFRFPGRGLLYGVLIFTQTIPLFGAGTADFKLKYDLGMINNPWTIWIGWAMGFDYSTIILLGAFQGISRTYSEAAEIDGANQFQIFFKIMFPQVFPAVMALMVTNFVTRWNSYETSQIVLRNYPNLAYGLFAALDDPNLTMDLGGKYAALVLTAIPGVLMYACFQNLIIKNMSVGGLKG